jgi:hypothetical protein
MTKVQDATAMPFVIRVDERKPEGWREKFSREYATRERALRDFGWTRGNPAYGPYGDRRMTLLGPDRTPGVTR